MRFMVTWHPDAQDELARIWLAAGDRPAITRATNEIDRLLAQSPEIVGEDFYGDRLVVVWPLAVTYHVSPPDLRVQVLQVSHQR